MTWKQEEAPQVWKLPCGRATLSLRCTGDVWRASLGDLNDHYFGGVSWDLKSADVDDAKAEALARAYEYSEKMGEEATDRMHAIKGAIDGATSSYVMLNPAGELLPYTLSASPEAAWDELVKGLSKKTTLERAQKRGYRCCHVAPVDLRKE